jgi:membrane protein
MSRWDHAIDTARTVARTSYDRDVQYPAAALAYYAFVAFLPLLVILLIAARDPIVRRVRAVTFRFLTPEARALVSEALTNSAGEISAGVFAVLVLVWSGINVTVGFQAFVERIEGSTERSRAGYLRDAAGILGSLAVGAGAIVATSVFFALFAVASYVAAGGLVVLLLALTAAFLPLYYLPSRALPAPSTALPGAVTAAVGWTTLLAVIRFYVVHADAYAIYGALSGVLLALTGLYAAAAVLMVGFVVNATLADKVVPSGPE